MALSNAERQRRHREKMKSKLVLSGDRKTVAYYIATEIYSGFLSDYPDLDRDEFVAETMIDMLSGQNLTGFRCDQSGLASAMAPAEYLQGLLAWTEAKRGWSKLLAKDKRKARKPVPPPAPVT